MKGPGGKNNGILDKFCFKWLEAGTARSTFNSFASITVQNRKYEYFSAFHLFAVGSFHVIFYVLPGSADFGSFPSFGSLWVSNLEN